MAKQSFTGGFMDLLSEVRANLAQPHEVAACYGYPPQEVGAFDGYPPHQEVAAFDGYPPPQYP